MTDKSMEDFEDAVDRLAEERGITFSAALALKTGDKPPAKKRAMTQAQLEELEEGVRELGEGVRELGEQSRRHLEMLCAREFTQMCEDGTVERRAREKGVAHQDAWRECMEEAYRPLTEVQLEESGRGLSSSPVMTENEERAQQGFTNKEVEWRAKSRGVPYREAFNQLSDEYAAKEAVRLEEREGASAVFLDEQAERRLDDEARAYAERHNCTYTTALEAVLEEM